MTSSLWSLCSETPLATGTSDRHVTRGPEAVGGGGDEQGSELWQVPHWSSTLPARGEDFPAEGAFPLLHGGGEPRVCHDYWQAHWSCGSQRGEVTAPVVVSKCSITEFHMRSSHILCLQLRKAIEDSNSGNVPSHQPPNITLTPPPGSGIKGDLPLVSDPHSNDTITSMDSALSSNTAASETDIEDNVDNSRLWLPSFLLCSSVYDCYDYPDVTLTVTDWLLPWKTDSVTG